MFLQDLHHVVVCALGRHVKRSHEAVDVDGRQREEDQNEELEKISCDEKSEDDDNDRNSLFVLLVNVCSFPQQQLRHLLPLRVWRRHRAVLTHMHTQR